MIAKLILIHLIWNLLSRAVVAYYCMNQLIQDTKLMSLLNGLMLYMPIIGEVYGFSLLVRHQESNGS